MCTSNNFIKYILKLCKLHSVDGTIFIKLTIIESIVHSILLLLNSNERHLNLLYISRFYSKNSKIKLSG